MAWIEPKIDWAIGNIPTSTDFNRIENNTNEARIHALNKTNPHEVTKAQVGLGNVDNTADADKPISNPTITYLQTNYEPKLNADQKRKITYGTADPTGGNDGDIYLQYEV